MAASVLLVWGLFASGCGFGIAPSPSASMPHPPLAPIEARLGVHTRLTEEVEEWKISRTLDLVRQMGAGWVVEYFPWLYGEPERGRYDWTHADLVVRHASARGLRLLARVDRVPTWARPPASSQQLLPQDSVERYAEYLGAFVQRYRHALAGVIVWNEPNLSSEWGLRPVDPEGYVHLLRVSARAVREASPEVPVIAAGLAPTLGDGWRAMSDLDFLARMYRLGAAEHFDALAVHAYGWRSPPAEPPAPEKINFRRTELLRDVMLEHGDADTPIVITEAGWNDHPRWSKAVRPGERIAYTLESLEMIEAWPWLESLNLWSFRLPTLAHNYNDYFTLVHPDFSLKPIYECLRLQAARATPSKTSDVPGQVAPESDCGFVAEAIAASSSVTSGGLVNVAETASPSAR